MDNYEVLLYPKAYRDMEDIYSYIAREKLSPINAKRQTDRIWKAIDSLSEFPEAHPERLVGRYAGKGYRQLSIDHYVAIYKVDKSSGKVLVLAVQYAGRRM